MSQRHTLSSAAPVGGRYFTAYSGPTHVKKARNS